MAGEFRCSGFTFFSDFDSGNLARVDSGHIDAVVSAAASEESCGSSSASQEPVTEDFAFDLWTKPDCAATEFENANRTWFFFGIRGGPDPDRTYVLRLTLRNLNKQSKLFSQGMSPVTARVHASKFHSARSKSSKQFKNPGSGLSWQRIKDRPTYYTDEKTHNFVLSFRIKIDPKFVTFLAFTYPYTYSELQTYLARLERRHNTAGLSYEVLTAAGGHRTPDSVYFHREFACSSYEGRRVDLITISSLQGILPEREPHLDNIFPQQKCRPFKFENKKVVFVSARVHPGETQSSFVINGFLKFILRESDARAVALRNKYVFKVMPMLNPDGVVRGHYRTDTRGVNLNRVYGKPSLTLHPTIYAARKLILYAHYGYEVTEERNEVDAALEETRSNIEMASSLSNPETGNNAEAESSSPSKSSSLPSSCTSFDSAFRWLRSAAANSSSLSPLKMHHHHHHHPDFHGPHFYEMTETSRYSEGDESIADFSTASIGVSVPAPARHASGLTTALLPPPAPLPLAPPPPPPPPPPVQHSNPTDIGPKGGQQALVSVPSSRASRPSREMSAGGTAAAESSARTTFEGAICVSTQCEGSSGRESSRVHLRGVSGSRVEDDASAKAPANSSKKLGKSAAEVNQEEEETQSHLPRLEGKSGLYVYIDIHGHASKRGIFCYGNHFNELDSKVDCMLLPKLMSINSANFDFPACNFTEKNMYLKDRHTGAGREGSGRVSVFKATGLVYSYTLECNFNSGRVVNAVPPATRDAGRTTPPLLLETPPKYDPAVFEEAGRAMAASILDLTESNPWSRLTCSSWKNLRGVKDWLRKYIKTSDEQSKTNVGSTSATSQATKTASGADSKTNASPTRATRRTRTMSSASLAMSAASKLSKSCSSSTSLSSSAATAKAIGPSSPDSYCPVTKVARKNCAPAANGAALVTGSQLINSGASVDNNSSSSLSRQLFRRSKSIPGEATGRQTLSLMTTVVKNGEDTTAAARDKTKKFKRKSSLATAVAVAVTRSHSLPNSRPTSPRRLTKGTKSNNASTIKRKAKKLLEKGGANANCRKLSSDTSSSVECSLMSPTTRKKKIMKKRILKT